MRTIKDELGDRIKNDYENQSKTYLVKHTPVLIRLDGKAFRSFTRDMRRPFDEIIIKTMQATAKFLCENIVGCKIAYVHSDKITLLLIDYDKPNIDAWFDYNVQKMCSISASMATLAFNKIFKENICNCDAEELDSNGTKYETYTSKFDMAMFDSRVFNIPKEEVCNAFIWRQQDAIRNSSNMVGQYYLSNKQIYNKNPSQIQELLLREKGINFNDLDVYKTRGSCIIKETYKNNEEIERTRRVVDLNIPIFIEDRDYIEKYL